MVRRLRRQPGAFGLVGANGGFLSKYSVGVYSTTPTPWRGFDSADLQREIDAWPAPPLAADGDAEGEVETYTIDYQGSAPKGIVIARNAQQQRFVAMTEPGDEIATRMMQEEPLGATITAQPDENGCRVITSFSPAR
jgi:acetyl-CoA C-acetyltransferase